MSTEEEFKNIRESLFGHKTNWDRYRKAHELRASGMTLKRVGEQLGVCQERARMMVWKYRRYWPT